MRSSLGILCAFWLVALAGGVDAATYVVLPDGTGDLPTIKAAVQAATSGDTIELGDGTFLGSGNRRINFGGKELVLRSAGGDPAACVIDCEGGGRGFLLSSGEGPAAVIEGITVRNGFTQYPDYGGSGIRMDGSSPTVRNCVFEANTALAGGGLREVAFGSGGALYSGGGAPVVTDCVFEGNSADYFGAGLFATEGATPAVNGCVFRNNHARSGGGAYAVAGGTRPVFDGCDFEANGADYGAGYYGDEGSAAEMYGCRFVENVSVGVGGGAAIWASATILLEDCLLVRNEATGGSGLYAGFLSDGTLRNCTLDGNVIVGGGGTVYSYQLAHVGLENSIVSSTVGGRAVLCAEGGTIDATCTDLFGNQNGDWTGCVAGQAGAGGNISLDPMYCDAPSDDYHLDDASPCASANSPAGCGLIGAYAAGCVSTGVASGDGEAPAAFRLAPNRPNPFNPTTTIRFEIPAEAAGRPFDLTIYDVAGRVIRTLGEGRAESGTHGVLWDGSADDGRPAPSGIYLYRLRVGAETATERMVLVR